MNPVVEESRRHLADLIEACRSLRNRAAHDYGPDFVITAEHFNALHEHIPMLKTVTLSLTDHAKQSLGIEPSDLRFAFALRQTGR